MFCSEQTSSIKTENDNTTMSIKNGALNAKFDNNQAIEIDPDCDELNYTARYTSVSGGMQGEIRSSELRTPMLNIVQNVGPLSENHRAGEILLDKQTKLSSGAEPIEITILGCKKYYQEKVAYGSDARPNIFETEAEVSQAGGSLEWTNNQPPSYEPVILVTGLIQCPDGVMGAFPYTYEGADYAICRWFIRGKAFKEAGRTLLTHASQLASIGNPLCSVRMELTSRREKLKNGNTVVVPVLHMKGKHDAGFVAFASGLLA